MLTQRLGAGAMTPPTSPAAALLERFAEMGYAMGPQAVGREMLGRWSLASEPVSLTILGTHPADADFKILWVRLGVGLEQVDGGVLGWQRRWAGRLWRARRGFRGLLVLSGPEGGARLVSVPHRAGETFGLHHIWLEGQSPRREPLRRLALLSLSERDTDGRRLAGRLKRDLDPRHTARRFIEDLRCVHDMMAAGVEGEVSIDLRRACALRTLTQLIFLCFVQQKGLLDGRSDFIRAELAKVAAQGGGIHRSFLMPLFFGVLNTPVERRPESLRGFGEIPYLNRGLFDPADGAISACISDAALEAAFEVLLDGYSFTVDEGAHSLGVNPGMLGRALESLMSSRRRQRIGAFYTPQGVVNLLVKEALHGLLVKLGVCPKTASSLLGPGRDCLLSPRRALMVRERLGLVAIMDPACGSGAFLLGVLPALESLHRRLAELAGQSRPDSAWLRRRIICRNLHGVDSDPDAVHLARLRLWLAIVEVGPGAAQMDPLPNLDCRVRRGDALLGTMGWLNSSRQLRPYADRINDLEALKHDFARASSEARPFWSSHLVESEAQLCRELLSRRVGTLKVQRDALKAAEVAGDPAMSQGDAVRARRGWLRLEELLDIDSASIEAIDEGSQVEGFSFFVHFAEVMARGGFDVVLMNPPWLRLKSVGPQQRAELKSVYGVLKRSAWTAGGTLEHHKGAGSQVDISACFAERSLSLLKPGGVLAAVLPTKLARALYGGGFRRLMMSEATVSWVSELAEAFPDASSRPMAVVASHTPPVRSAQVSVEAAGGRREVALRSLRLDSDDLASPWILGCEPEHLGPGLMRLGDHPALEVRRGVMTGLNCAFVSAEPVEPGSTHRVPLLRGGDIRAWRAEPSSSLRWPHDLERGEPLPQLPRSLERALGAHRAALERRSGLNQRDPWWRIFRTGPHLFGPKVAWRDIGKRLEAAAIPACGEFGGVLGPIVPINTVYFIPVSTMAQALVLAAFLNSTSVRRYANALGERAVGEFRRFFAWLAELLPLPDPLALALRDAQSWDRALSSDPDLISLLHHSGLLHAGAGPDAEESGLAVDGAVNNLYRRSRSEKGAL